MQPRCTSTLRNMHILILLPTVFTTLHFNFIALSGLYTESSVKQVRTVELQARRHNLSNLLINYVKVQYSQSQLWRRERREKTQHNLNETSGGWALGRGKILDRKPHVFVKPYSPRHGVTHVIGIEARSVTASHKLPFFLFFFARAIG